ncbi:MAG: multiprotein-bridging factor 1 family protein [Candidatus Aenigmatarchaeota archaeon]
MAECELCGRKAETTAEVEGAVVGVCYRCAGGSPKPAERKRQFRRAPRMPEELEQTVVHDFSSIIKSRREKMGLTQKQFAEKVQENENVIRRIEEGWIPPFGTVRKFEKFLKTNLIEKAADARPKKGRQERITIGDVVEVK